MTQRIGASRTENRPRMLRVSHIMPSWLLGCGIFVCLALIPIHVWAQQPVIRSIVPAQPTVGQVITIQGHSLFSTDITVTVQIPGAQPPSGDALVLESASNPNEVYVRLPSLFFPSGGVATLELVVNGIRATCSFSATCSFQVAANPAAPIPRRICDTSSISLGCSEIQSVGVGQPIVIQAFGTDIDPDISGFTAVAVFSQGTDAIPVQAEDTFMNSTIGIVHEFLVPNLAPGPALVQLRIDVMGIEGELSFALPLAIQ